MAKIPSVARMARHRSAPPTPAAVGSDRVPERQSTDRRPADWRSVDRRSVDRVASLRRPVLAPTGWVPDSDLLGRADPASDDAADLDEVDLEEVDLEEADLDEVVGDVTDPESDAGDDVDVDPLRGVVPDTDTDPAADPADDRAAEQGTNRRLRARRIRHGWSRLSETWVPEPLRDARIDPGRRGALLLSLIAALAAVAAAIGVWRDRPEPRPVRTVVAASLTDTVGSQPALSSGARGAAPRPASAGSAQRPAAVPAPDTGSAVPEPAVIAVSVTGEVRRPGLVRIPARSRVADAIAAAGGVSDDADLTGLNLASVLSDGESVVVGDAATPGGQVAGPSRIGPASTGPAAAGTFGGPPGGPAGASAPVDLNVADAPTLETLPGVGPVMAGNIIAWREQNGSFTSVEQLQEVSGIGPARFAQLSPLVTVG